MTVLHALSLRIFAILFLAISAFPISAEAQIGTQSEVRTDQVRAVLLAHAPQGVPTGAAAPGEAPQVWVGLQLTHQPDWHTYWKNSGDSGLPTELQWTLPPGVMAGDIAWPLPRKIPIGDLANYGYEGTVLLPVPLIITPEYQPPVLADTLDIHLKASWLACRMECIPQDGEFTLKLPLRSSTALNAAAFGAALASQPADLPGAGQQAQVSDDGTRLALRLRGLPESVRGQSLELFPETPNVLMTAAHLGDAPGPRTWTQRWDGGDWVADVPVSADRAGAPSHMPFVVVAGERGWRADAPVAGEWPALAPLAGMSPALQAALQANAAASTSPTNAVQAVPARTFALALLGALIGGAILNLMPCVFPILAIKVLGFTQHAGDRRAQRAGGLAYSAGVVLSFVLLGALMLGLRAAGEQLGWGFQLQSPLVVALLATLFTVIALNLAGVFEFGQFLPSGVATLEARHPTVNAALSGVLAVAVASPCTAPFMGASLGLAVGLPALQALLLFAVLGLGMALPYLLASWLPALARALPRPGAWMDTFKKFMAFPMFGTAVWLLWVLGQQSGIDGAAALLALLVLLAFALWVLGLAGRTRWWLGGLTAVLALLVLPSLAPHVVAPLAGAAQAASAAPGARWQPWSAERAQALVAEGKPVFVDFTAAWCVTCQYNKKTTLASAEVLAAFDAAGVQTLRADWTRRDAAITAELQKLGRSGVPVYVLQAPGQAPVVLSEILSVGEVKAALQQL